LYCNSNHFKAGVLCSKYSTNHGISGVIKCTAESIYEESVKKWDSISTEQISFSIQNSPLETNLCFLGDWKKVYVLYRKYV